MDANELFSLISGDGAINMNNIKAKNNYSVISGSGNMALFGHSNNSYLAVNGTGNIYSYSLDTYHSTCDISGSAGIRVKADSTLSIFISGYANLFYKGFPLISSNITGDGNVVDDN